MCSFYSRLCYNLQLTESNLGKEKIDLNDMIHFHIDPISNPVGFSVTNVEKEKYAWILTSSSLTSDELDFYKYVDQISNIFFNQATYRIITDAVHRFLILIHKNLSADVYINDFPFQIKMRAKRSIEAGTLVTSNDIADITELSFPRVNVQESDRVIFCFKVGWKFGLYFDLEVEGVGDISLMQANLGRLYRYLSFQHVYRTLESPAHFEKMVKDGWFPFVEILGSEYKTLVDIYENEKFAYDERVGKILDKFDKSRIEGFTDKWWTHPTFEEKRKLLQAGIDAFLQGNDSGYVNCINTLYPQIEGIVRVQYFKATAKGKNVRLKELIDHLIEMGKESAGDADSLLLPLSFLEYLNDCIFVKFNLEDGTVDLSRHSTAHGVAAGEDYTRMRALQALLALDQIYFYLVPPPRETEPSS